MTTQFDTSLFLLDAGITTFSMGAGIYTYPWLECQTRRIQTDPYELPGNQNRSPSKAFSFPGSVLQKAHKRRPILEERWRKPQQSFQFFSWYLFPIKKYPMLLHLHLLQGETRYSDNAQTHRYRSSFTRNWTTLVKKKKGILVCWVASISYFVYWVSLWFW